MVPYVTFISSADAGCKLQLETAKAARVGLRASLAGDDGGAEATERAGGVMAWKR